MEFKNELYICINQWNVYVLQAELFVGKIFAHASEIIHMQVQMTFMAVASFSVEAVIRRRDLGCFCGRAIGIVVQRRETGNKQQSLQ